MYPSHNKDHCYVFEVRCLDCGESTGHLPPIIAEKFKKLPPIKTEKERNKSLRKILVELDITLGCSVDKIINPPVIHFDKRNFKIIEEGIDISRDDVDVTDVDSLLDEDGVEDFLKATDGEREEPTVIGIPTIYIEEEELARFAPKKVYVGGGVYSATVPGRTYLN